jgi:acetyl-CoA synthetase
VQPQLVDNEGKVLEGAADGNLCITDSWPGQMRTVYGDHERFVQTYFSNYKGRYFTGDGCRRDEDGYYWITGRVDDVINVSGHRMGTAEVESALVSHDKVSEAAVVGYPHDIKGQGIYCYVTLMAGMDGSEDLRKELVAHVRKEIGRLHPPTRSSFRPACPRRVPARSCAASCARSRKTISARSEIPRRWPTPPSSTISSRTGRTRNRGRWRAGDARW